MLIPQTYKVHWGPTMSQLMLATNEGTVNIYSMPDMTVMWSLKAHHQDCLSFSVDRDYR